jgi:hypothetical protein
MTAQAPVVQGAVSEALSEQDIAFGADLWRRRNVSEKEIPLSMPRYWMPFRRSSVSKRISASVCHICRTPRNLWPGSREVNALFSLARAFGEGQ